MNTRFALLVLAFLSTPLWAGEWKLIWNDEFDKPGLPDPAKWSYEEGFIRNNEKQYYTRARQQNARVENGMLVIEARKEQFKNPHAGRRGPEVAEYTSASLTTLGKASWNSGRVEVRAKLPTGRGVWPAIWMLGTNLTQVGWPACGEIDIMELVGYEPGIIHATVHMQKFNHANKTSKGGKITMPDAAQAFHVYAVEWDADQMDFYVDDHKYFTFRNEKSGPAAWPFNQNQYLILNLAIGGAWGGQKGIDDSLFPHKYYIDYVRVFRKD